MGSRVRTPTSERGGGTVRGSRPPSSQKRRQHARNGSNGSTGSHHYNSVPASVRGGGSPAPSFRRPLTSTTVRRISNSTYTQKRHGRKGSASSVGTEGSRRSSLNRELGVFQGGFDEESEEDEVIGLGGEEIDPIQEECESIADNTFDGLQGSGGNKKEVDDLSSLENPGNIREKTLRKLSREIEREFLINPPSPTVTSSKTPTSSTFFVAHRNKSLFGPPSLSLKHGSPRRPSLKDVFKKPSSTGANNNDESDWVDEDDEFAGYSGGLGQGGSSIRSNTPSSTSSDGNEGNSNSNPSVTNLPPMLGEGRYAGISAMRGDTFDGSWKGTMGSRKQPAQMFRGPTITEEEEEEE
jgi:hypothetical protein